MYLLQLQPSAQGYKARPDQVQGYLLQRPSCNIIAMEWYTLHWKGPATSMQ